MSEKEMQAFPDEISYLALVGNQLKEALEEAEGEVARMDREYRDEKHYMARYRGEIDPHEMFQNELALRQIDGSGAFAVKMRDRLLRLRDSPYFARVDFRERGEGEALRHYIGPSAFRHKGELLICDWRSPVASLFYDREVGPASYEAPMGRTEGTLERKRQFKIRAGVMEYALESTVSIQDDVLQRELSHTSDEKMKSIIATIQKEQNQIIRSERAGTLLIQGVAGSGKTSIALHRIAYLLYRFKDKLSARNVVILSPNRVFGDYISGVLPELGEEPVSQLGFEDLARVQLEGVDFEPDAEKDDEAWGERVRLKSTLGFLEQLERYCGELSETVFVAADYAFHDFTAGADFLRERFAAYAGYPVKQRLRRMADDLCERFAAENFMGDDLPKPQAILKSLTGMLRVKDTPALYRDFYRWLGVPHMLVLPGKKTLEWADVYPFLYLKAAFEGVKTSSFVRHLVVDEMQDYTPVQYAVLNLLFPCDKTILGDFGQLVRRGHGNTLEDLRRLYNHGQYVELNRSYRSTYEIMGLAKRVGRVEALEPVARHGEEPRIVPCGGQSEQLEEICGLIERFKASGRATLGILEKTEQGAAGLYEALSRRQEVYLLTGESRRFANGVTVASIRMSKGLEFDEVIVPDVDGSSYATEYDRGLLYIACTRALHRLTVTCAGEVSALMG